MPVPQGTRRARRWRHSFRQRYVLKSIGTMPCGPERRVSIAETEQGRAVPALESRRRHLHLLGPGPRFTSGWGRLGDLPEASRLTDAQILQSRTLEWEVL